MAADHLQPPDVDLARVRRGDPFARWFWSGVLIATLAHLAVFVANPGLTIAVPDDPEPRVTVVVDIPDIRIPPPPEPYDRPLPPALPEGPIVFVPVPDPVRQPDHERPLTPPEPSVDEGREPIIVPVDVAPEIRDAARAREIVQRHYPRTLRDAGIAGTVVFWARIDADGSLRELRLYQSSGYVALDDAAERSMREIASEVGFRPAQRLDRAVAVWIRQAIIFSVR